MDIEEPMKIYRTTNLQIMSLERFAKVLGYIPRNADNLGQGFRIIDFRSWHTHYISFRDMCKLHNGIITRVIFNSGMKVYDFLELSYIDVSDESYDRAFNSRLVKQVKLQRDKKSYLGVKVQNHFVRQL